MDREQYSLNDLRDVVIPDLPPFWPPAPGVWVVLALVTAVVLILCWRLHGVWKRNAHRRAGLVLLDDASTAHDVSMVLKRVALAAFPRQQVASLYGEAWVAFLSGTCSQGSLSEIVGADSGAPASRELIELAGTWIRRHRIPEYDTRDAEH